MYLVLQFLLLLLLLFPVFLLLLLFTTLLLLIALGLSTWKAHGQCDLMSMSFEQVQLVRERVVFRCQGSDAIVQPGLVSPAPLGWYWD